MEVGSQTEPMDPLDILNLLRLKSSEMERKVGVKAEDQDEIHSVEVIEGEVFFNSHNEPEFRKNSHPGGKSTSIKSKSHPLGQPSLTDKICEAVWGRKESLRVTAEKGSSSSSKSKKLGRSQSFKGSSSTSSSLSPTKIHMVDGTFMDPYARRASGCTSYSRSSGNNPISGSREYLPPASPKFDSSRVRRSHGDIDIRRQISATLSIPSRQDSVKSTSSKSTSGQVSPIIIRPDTNANVTQPLSSKTGQQRLSHVQGSSSSKSLVPSTSARGSRSSSITHSTTGGGGGPHQNPDLALKDQRGRKYIIIGFSILLLVAVACVVISLSISSYIDAKVRKENENLMRVIQQTTSNSNMTSSNNSQSSSTFSPLSPIIQIEDQDENSGNYDSNNNNNNNNNNYNNNLNPGQSLTRRVITVDPGQEETKINIGKKGSGEIDRGGGDGDGKSNRPLSSSLIGEVLLNNTNNNNIKIRAKDNNKYDDEQTKNTQTQFKSENSNILLGQISDIDEVERVRTSIVLR